MAVGLDALSRHGDSVRNQTYVGGTWTTGTLGSGARLWWFSCYLFLRFPTCSLELGCGTTAGRGHHPPTPLGAWDSGKSFAPHTQGLGAEVRGGPDGSAAPTPEPTAVPDDFLWVFSMACPLQRPSSGPEVGASEHLPPPRLPGDTAGWEALFLACSWSLNFPSLSFAFVKWGWERGFALSSEGHRDGAWPHDCP